MAAQDSQEILGAVSHLKGTLDYWNKELRQIDERLQMVWFDEGVNILGVVPCRYHILRRNEPRTDGRSFRFRTLKATTWSLTVACSACCFGMTCGRSRRSGRNVDMNGWRRLRKIGRSSGSVKTVRRDRGSGSRCAGYVRVNEPFVAVVAEHSGASRRDEA